MCVCMCASVCIFGLPPSPLTNTPHPPPTTTTPPSPPPLQVCAALTQVGMPRSTMEDMWRVLSGLLALGNVDFSPKVTGMW